MSHDFFKRIHSSVTITPCCVADRRTNEGGDDQSRKVGKELHTSPLSSLLSLLSPLYSPSFFPDSSDRDSALVQSKRDGRQSRKGGSRVRSLLRPFDPLIWETLEKRRRRRRERERSRFRQKFDSESERERTPWSHETTPQVKLKRSWTKNDHWPSGSVTCTSRSLGHSVGLTTSHRKYSNIRVYPREQFEYRERGFNIYPVSRLVWLFAIYKVSSGYSHCE